MITCARITDERGQAMYNSYIIGLCGSTDPFHAKNKVNATHNECIIGLICSFVQESPKNKVKALYNFCIIELFCATVPSYT